MRKNPSWTNKLIWSIVISYFSHRSSLTFVYLFISFEMNVFNTLCIFYTQSENFWTLDSQLRVGHNELQLLFLSSGIFVVSVIVLFWSRWKFNIFIHCLISCNKVIKTTCMSIITILDLSFVSPFSLVFLSLKWYLILLSS